MPPREAVEVVSEFWREAFLQQIPHLRGPVAEHLNFQVRPLAPQRRHKLADVLAGYEDFFEFNARELHLVEALRTLRMIHYEAWLARRWDDPAFPAAFPWFNTQRYWQDQILDLREQVARLDEPSLLILRDGA